MSHQAPPAFTDALARRLVSAIVLAPGVSEAMVCGREGEVAVSSGGADPGKEAALTRFLVQRAEAMTADGDLRGMGRTVAASHLEQITLSDPSGDSLLLAMPECFALVSLRRGATANSVASSIRVIARRYHEPRPAAPRTETSKP